jgi:hypothetical protein
LDLQESWQAFAADARNDRLGPEKILDHLDSLALLVGIIESGPTCSVEPGDAIGSPLRQ